MMSMIRFSSGRISALLIAALWCVAPVAAREYHVDLKGNDAAEGTPAAPFRTIGRAAEAAQPGDVVVVHEGIYREQVEPVRGGSSPQQRITYRAAEGEHVEIRGSEQVEGWKQLAENVWTVSIPARFFGKFNPFREELGGDWFQGHGRVHHAGEVFVNGKALYEVPSLKAVQEPKPLANAVDAEASTWVWYCESDDRQTRIYANFHGSDPNRELVEITVRESCFYPAKPGVDYIAVQGFHLSQAATPWAPPTAEQVGLIGTHWSKGWLIEDNVIHDSKCVGITLGKDRASGQNVWSANPQKDGATHYNEVIFRALRLGWSKERIGSHLVRNNVIYNCEQAGIVGSLGAVFSTIEQNHIYNIWTKRQFSGAEIAGIKIHAAIDVRIEGNHIHDAARGIWLDWMAQGTRVTRNLCYDNSLEDLFVEVNHGPFVIDNNLFLSATSVRCWSEGGAWMHNLLTGRTLARKVLSRCTPYHFPHSTAVAGVRSVHGGQNRFYNNIFVGIDRKEDQQRTDSRRADRNAGFGLMPFVGTSYEIIAEGNIYLAGAMANQAEVSAVRLPDHDPSVRLERKGDEVWIEFSAPSKLFQTKARLVTTEVLGKTRISGLPFEESDGSPLVVGADFFGEARSRQQVIPGPFSQVREGANRKRVW